MPTTLLLPAMVPAKRVSSELILGINQNLLVLPQCKTRALCWSPGSRFGAGAPLQLSWVKASRVHPSKCRSSFTGDINLHPRNVQLHRRGGSVFPDPDRKLLGEVPKVLQVPPWGGVNAAHGKRLGEVLLCF